MMQVAIERVVTAAGPIVVKEVRQGLRGRAFAVFFTLMLLACVSIAVIAAAVVSQSELEVLGPIVFTAYLWLVAGLCFFIIPYQAFRAMLSEREDETWVLLVLTGLGGKQIARGKYSSAMSQAALFGSACAPFVVFSYYLNGIDLMQVVLALVLAAAMASLLVSVSLLIGAEAKTRLSRIAAHFAVLALLAVVTMGCLGFVSFLSSDTFRRISGKQIAVLISLCVGFCTLSAQTSWLFLDYAGMAMSLPADGDAVPPRKKLIGSALFNVIATSTVMMLLNAESDDATVAGIIYLVWLVIFAVLAVSENDGWPRAFAKVPWLGRPGASRSTLTVWALALFGSAAFFLVRLTLNKEPHGAPLILFAGAGYIILFTSLAAFLGRFTPLNALGVSVGTRVGFIGSLILGTGSLAFFMLLGRMNARDASALNVLSPFVGMVMLLDRRTGSEGLILSLGVCTAVALMMGWAALNDSDKEF